MNLLSNQEHSASSSPPLVSVSMTAFNSEKWLSKALDSVLLQQTDFRVEVLVGDDYSTDGTLAIAYTYQRQYPNLIRVLERTTKFGMQRNYYDTFEQCQGKYIAWLDADDYWTDPEKLALQVQALDSDPSIGVCSHFVRAITADGTVTEESSPAMQHGRYGLADIVRRNFVPSVSIMFRNGVHRDLPEWFFELAGLADWPILILASLSGDILLLDRVMADYRLTPGSAYMSKSPLYQDELDLHLYEHLTSLLPPPLHRVVRSARGERYESMAYELRKKGDFTAARRAALKALRTPALADNFGSKIKTFLATLLGEAGSKLHRGQAAN